MINRTRSGREITERGLNWIGGNNLSDTTVENLITNNEPRRVGQR
jgi:hypothetical protein